MTRIRKPNSADGYFPNVGAYLLGQEYIKQEADLEIGMTRN